MSDSIVSNTKRQELNAHQYAASAGYLDLGVTQCCFTNLNFNVSRFGSRFESSGEFYRVFGSSLAIDILTRRHTVPRPTNLKIGLILNDKTVWHVIQKVVFRSFGPRLSIENQDNPNSVMSILESVSFIGCAFKPCKSNKHAISK